ncbi:MAG: phage Gp37/Gp68 family protein [Sulfurospirillum sp.]|nr:phage Gp37/Gp68 family protein [Sulfurospirillum sp.]
MPKSKIEWTQHTWNPVTGCKKISAGCQNCYAENMAKRFGGEDAFKVTLHPDKLDVPLKRKKPTTYFVCSMSDLFHEDVPFEFISKVFSVMQQNQRHTFQVLTKRPERVLEYYAYQKEWLGIVLPLKNVWLGVTAENQKEANHRIPILLSTPAALRFVSIEPMLEQIDLEDIRDPKKFPSLLRKDVLRGQDIHEDDDDVWTPIEKIDWVICGGESGQKARSLNPLWVKSLQEQCTQANTPFFFKQWGEFTCKDGEMIRVGKKEAGYLIDGKEYREMPYANKN